jgi:hypothetical protein
MQPKKTTDFGSGGSRQSSEEVNRKSNPFAATVEEENSTRISDDRPSTVNITTRSTRFGGAKSAQHASNVNLPKTFTSSKDFLRNMAGRSVSKGTGMPRIQNQTVTSQQGTVQSFLLPDMPNISELVSGVFEDGTPIFSRHGKPRVASRLPSQSGRKSRFEHRPVGEIAIPEDEEAIFVSLRLLQEKIADLETKRAEQESEIQNLQTRNQFLEQEKLQRKCLSSRDSGLGQTSGSDADDDLAKGSRKHIIEKTRKFFQGVGYEQTDMWQALKQLFVPCRNDLTLQLRSLRLPKSLIKIFPRNGTPLFLNLV